MDLFSYIRPEKAFNWAQNRDYGSGFLWMSTFQCREYRTKWWWRPLRSIKLVLHITFMLLSVSTYAKLHKRFKRKRTEIQTIGKKMSKKNIGEDNAKC